MFYENQSERQKLEYKNMLSIIGKLTRLFSDSDSPYLPYRVQENVFCKYFQADNISRSDCSADAKKNNIGIGLKTWVGSDDQKVAEFNRLRTTFAGLTGLELVRRISVLRNERIRVTKNLHGLTEMVYHIVKRIPGQMQICEHSFDFIDIENIRLLDDRSSDNNIYFADGNHVYHFSLSKNTLYMIFENLEILDTFGVDILEDPYTCLSNINNALPTATGNQQTTVYEQICLRLYSTKRDGSKFVFEKSGLNQWNAQGRPRHPSEIYIPFPAEDRDRNIGFFPPAEQPFNLRLPNGNVISANICQENGKAIMSNPNKVLGEWLLRDVFELQEGTLVTYDMLELFGIDSVVITKYDNENYSIDFSEIGTYEQFYNLENEE